MLSRAVLHPGGVLVGALAALAAWALGVRPLAAAVFGALVAAVEVLGAVAVTQPDRRRRPSPPEASAQPSPAPAVAPPPAGGPEAGVFRPEGELWRVGMGGSVYLVRDAKGLRYLRLLLADPGREFHVLQLVEAVDGSARAFPVSPGAPEGTGPGVAGEPRLDARAKAAYRERLQELRLEAEEARRWHDNERAVRAEAEIEALAGELARAVGLGGRDRRTGAQAERARLNVTRAIRAAIDRIAEQDRSIGHHLSSTVRTGTFCSYAPDPVRPPTWDL